MSLAKKLAMTVLGLLFCTALALPLLRGRVLHFTPEEQHPLMINASPLAMDVPNTFQELDGNKAWFSLIDLNHDHVITLVKTPSGRFRSPELDTLHRRFIRLAHIMENSPNKLISQGLTRIDKDHNGRISTREFIDATRWMRLSVASLQAMDKNHDNRISVQEFQGVPIPEPFILGTDNMGRDMVSRLLEGLRTSVLLALIAGFFSLVIGVAYGVVAGYAKGWVDVVMMRIVDVMYGLPYILLVVVLISIRGPGFFNLVIAILMVQWLPVARTVRTLVISASQEDFVLAAKGLGAGPFHVIRRHILPQIVGPAMTLIFVLTPNVVRQEVLLSFLGLGITPPQASLGSLISDGLSSLTANPLAILWPTITLILLLLSLQVIESARKPSKTRKD